MIDETIQIQCELDSPRSLVGLSTVSKVGRIRVPSPFVSSCVEGASDSVSPHARGHKVRSRWDGGVVAGQLRDRLSLRHWRHARGDRVLLRWRLLL